jgi:hypothetical protein
MCSDAVSPRAGRASDRRGLPYLRQIMRIDVYRRPKRRTLGGHQPGRIVLFWRSVPGAVTNQQTRQTECFCPQRVVTLG